MRFFPHRACPILGYLVMWAFVAGVFCAVATGYLKDSRIRQDTVMGIVFFWYACRLILHIAVKPDVHLDHSFRRHAR